jgi:hypothetical protein
LLPTCREVRRLLCAFPFMLKKIKKILPLPE